MTGPIKSIL